MTKPFHGSVGVFWVVRGAGGHQQALFHVCPSPEMYGDKLTCPHGHYELWEEWRDDLERVASEVRKLVESTEYEVWPRGRVVYGATDDQFVIYADVQIFNRSDLMARIQGEFRLPPDRTTGQLDSHYVSTERLSSPSVRTKPGKARFPK